LKGLYFIKKQWCSPERCQEIDSQLLADKHVWSKDQYDPNIKKTADVTPLAWSRAKNYVSDLLEYSTFTNQMYFGFDIYPFSDHLCVNHNQYNAEKQGEYDWHYDGLIKDVYDVKLTVVLNISTGPVEGGGFELFSNGGPKRIYEIDEPGTLLIFPSWLYHRVLPVTKGTRKTLSMWLIGPLIK
jgi:PKHD-type hydroxylase